MAVAPSNCQHNVPFGVPGTTDEVRVCSVGSDKPGWRGTVCDERYNGCARASSCGLFTLKANKYEVKDAFYAELEGMTFPEIAYHFPDMAALLWVLSEDGHSTSVPDANEFDLSDVSVPTPIEVPVASVEVTEAPITPEQALRIEDHAPGWEQLNPVEGLVETTDPGVPSTREPIKEDHRVSWIDRLLWRVP